MWLGKCRLPLPCRVYALGLNKSSSNVFFTLSNRNVLMVHSQTRCYSFSEFLPKLWNCKMLFTIICLCWYLPNWESLDQYYFIQQYCRARKCRGINNSLLQGNNLHLVKSSHLASIKSWQTCSYASSGRQSTPIKYIMRRFWGRFGRGM